MEGLDDNLVKLRIISSLGPQERLRIHSDGRVSLEPTRTLMSSVVRWWYGDSRLRTIQYVRTTLTDAVRHLCQLYRHDPVSSEDICLLAQELKGSLNGVENLKKTYAGDVQVVSLLDVIQKKVETHLKRVSKDHPSIATSIEEDEDQHTVSSL